MSTTAHLAAAIVLALAACRSANVADAAPLTARGDEPRIVTPKDQQHIGVDGDPACPEVTKSCPKVRVEIHVPKGLTPFIAVEPELISPKMFIQPAIHGVRADGSASGLAYLGEEDNGARQYFKIHLFACKDSNRYRSEEQIVHFPSRDDCMIANSIEVYRER